LTNSEYIYVWVYWGPLQRYFVLCCSTESNLSRGLENAGCISDFVLHSPSFTVIRATHQ